MVVAVSPRILGDALSVALREHDLEVIVCLPGTVSAVDVPFDVALMTEPAPSDVAADALVILPATPGDHMVTIVLATGVVERRALVGLDDVVDLVEGLANGRG